MADQAIKVAVLANQLGCRLRPDLWYAGYIVSGITNQCQVIDEFIGLYAEASLHSLDVGNPVIHRIDQRYTFIHQLRHVLVTGRNQHIHRLLHRLRRERTNDIIGFDTVNDQQRQAHGFDDFI